MISIKNQVWADNISPLVSVLCPTYKHVQYIRKCLDSILSQETSFRVEVIVRDDASTDGTTEILREYQTAYPDLVKCIFETENQYVKGIRALPVLVRHATGKYVALCEGDDYWCDNDKLEQQVAMLEQNPNCFMCAAKTRIEEEGKTDAPSVIFHGLPQEFLSFEDLFSRCYLHTSTYVMLSYRDVFDRWEKHIRLSDTALHLIYSDLGPVVFLPKVVSVYRITGEGVWSRLTEEQKLKEELDLYKSFYRHFHLKYKKRFFRLLIEQYLRAIKISHKRYRWRSTFSHLVSFLRHTSKSPIRAYKHVQRLYRNGSL